MLLHWRKKNLIPFCSKIKNMIKMQKKTIVSESKEIATDFQASVITCY